MLDGFSQYFLSVRYDCHGDAHIDKKLSPTSAALPMLSKPPVGCAVEFVRELIGSCSRTQSHNFSSLLGFLESVFYEQAAYAA